MKKQIQKYAIVTGGARGIGKEITKKLLENGFIVLICSRNKEEINRTCEELDPTLKRILGIAADVSVIDDCKKIIDHTYKLFGTVDVLINNAAIYGPIGLVETNSPTEWKKTIEVNLLGTVACTQYVIPIMKKNKKGKIINIVGGGVGGSNPISRFSAYVTSKTAIAGFTEVIAKELLDWNIQVNCISPGAIKTQLIQYLLKQGREKAGDEMYNQALNTTAKGGDDPNMIAKIIAFLASDDSNHLTGRIFSAKWETVPQLQNIKKIQNNLYTLRRIDDVLFTEKRKR